MIHGNDMGKQGKVLRVDRKLNRVLVEGVNFVAIFLLTHVKRKRHIKGTDEQPGGIFDVESPIAYSNVQLVDPSTGYAVFLSPFPLASQPK